MAIDPVCGMTVDEKSAPDRAPGSASYGGQAYYFCSARCLNQFQADPAKFVGETRQAGRNEKFTVTVSTR